MPQDLYVKLILWGNVHEYNFDNLRAKTASEVYYTFPLLVSFVDV